MTVRSLSEVFLPGAAELPEKLRTLVVTPTRFIEPGTTVEATFGFYNSGGAVATGLRVRFALPEGLAYISGSSRIDGAAQGEIPDGAFVAATGALLGEIAPGVERRVSLLYKVAEYIEDGTTIALQAALAANETLIVGSNIVRLVVRSRPMLHNAQTIVSLEAPAGAEPGRELLVRTPPRVTNLGQSSANDVVLGFPVPEHTRYSPRTARIDGRLLNDDRQAPFDPDTATIIAERLLPGQTVVADFIAAIESPLDNGTSIIATARLSSREVPEFEVHSNEIVVASMASFDGDGTAFGIAGDDEVVPGMRLRMELRAANVGTSGARNVTARIQLPVGLVYSPGSVTLDGLPMSDEHFEELSYTFEAIVPGRAVQLAFDAVVVAPAAPGAKLPVTAKLTWETGERSFARTLTIRSEPRFTRSKNIIERDGPPIAEANEEVGFTVHILNDGTAPATDARLLVRSDEHLTGLVAASDEGAVPISDNVLALGTLDPHIERRVRIQGRIAAPIADRTEVAVGAELATKQVGTIDLGVASYIVHSRPRFAAEECQLILPTQEALRPGSPVTLVVRLANTGTDIARDVRVVVHYPPEVTVTSADVTPLIDGELYFDSVLPGVSREAQITVALASFVPSGSLVTIEARIEAQGLSPLLFAPVHIETRAEAEFAGEIHLDSTPPDEVDAGAPLSYALRFRNVGDGPAQAVVVRARQPEQLIYVPATTRVNQLRIDDENGTSPLWSLHGLVLTDVDPGVPVVVSWESVVTAPLASGTTLNAQATVEWDEQGLTVVSDNVVVRSSPQFASSPGGRSISIARLMSSGNQGANFRSEAPMQLARPRPIELERNELAPAEELPILAPPPNLEPVDTALDLPFFSAPPAIEQNEYEEDPSNFTLVDPHAAAPSFSAPQAPQEEHDFAASPFFSAAPLEAVEEPSMVAGESLEDVPQASFESEETVTETSEPLDTPSEMALEPVETEYEPISEVEPERTAIVAEEIPAPILEPQPKAEIPVITSQIQLATAPISVLAFAPDRLRRTLSFLQQSNYGKLISHLFALEAFFPDRILNEPELDDLFVSVRDAFRSTLDRLFVRLRLPRYAIAARDLEDRSSRDAILALAQRIESITDHSQGGDTFTAHDGAIRIVGEIDAVKLSHALEGLQEAPLGGVTPWIAYVSLLGTTIEVAGEQSSLLGTYRNALLSILSVLEALPISEFHRVLTSSSNADLDQALNEVVRVLGGPREAAVR